jgi:hypothetical protein
MNVHTFARMAGTRQVLMRRHVLGALTLAASVLLLGASTAWASGGPAEFEAFTEWSAPVNLGPPVNTAYEESAPAMSDDSRNLYFNRNPNLPDDNDEDLFVSHRSGPREAWGDPVALDVLNTPTFHERNVTVSPDGRLLFFSSNRTPGGFGRLDLYVSRRTNRFAEWSPPVNVGAMVNGPADDVGPAYLEDEDGNAVLYFTSNRVGGPGGFDIYVSALGGDGSVGMPLLVQELSSTSNDARPAIRADGLEVVFQSNRLPSNGAADLWTSARESRLEPWGPPVNLGAVVNGDANDRQAALSDDAEMLLFASNRFGGLGSDDIWTSTREKSDQEPD